MNYKRIHFDKLLKRIREPRKFIQVITGPRQVGKTTLVGQIMEVLDLPYHFISADEAGILFPSWLNQQWETARIKLGQSSEKELLLIIDEVQKVKNWSETIKSLWDTDTLEHINIKVILLGSSRLLVQEGLTESLAGRFELIFMEHWSYPEMRDAFGFNPEQYAWYGGYPGSATLIPEEKHWKEYIKYAIIEATISRDILMLTRIHKPALLKNLFELGCRYSGQILSFNKLLGQLQDAGNTTTLSHYLDLLDTAGMLSGLQTYSPNLIRQKSSSPKFQVHNTALLSAQDPLTFAEIRMQPDNWRRIVESCIGAHLLNHANSSDLKIFYWRFGNYEVDYILEHHGKIIALEVKSGFYHKTSGIRKFSEQYHPDKVLVTGQTGLPWQEFITMSPVELF